ncbi:MAG: hypothetical protein LBU19_11150 [Treponema sp.]|jgi:hypothetical protein|nr:hypothetical protein [Treponema sp.]
MHKYFFVLLFVLFFIDGISAYSYKREYIQVINHSDKNIEVSAEFWANQDNMTLWWNQDIDNINVNVWKGIFSETNTHILRPEEDFVIVSYSPNHSSFEFSEYYYKLGNLPLSNKLTAIFKSLVIYNERGEILLILDALDETNVRLRASDNINRYYIEIYDAYI